MIMPKKPVQTPQSHTSIRVLVHVATNSGLTNLALRCSHTASYEARQPVPALARKSDAGNPPLQELAPD